MKNLDIFIVQVFFDLMRMITQQKEKENGNNEEEESKKTGCTCVIS